MTKLIFVYNADSGKVNALLDIAHKIIRPETYSCSLCAITHDALSEKKAWAEFRKNTKLELEFLHKDEFEKKYQQTFEYPVILEHSDPIRAIINSGELNKLSNVEELIRRIEQLTSY